MYQKYFGLHESSFSIAPDPHYLFLSAQHREALAHLLYGAGESGGFVLLTGEVGTGKTTVCRAFLEQLPAGVDVALILNPTQTATELLLNLCDEFRIDVADGESSTKVLVDRLNRYLLESHGNGRRPVLIVDEAQNLQPQVLEQIRLLTNLETTKHKLLQIFLIGQPELRCMLEREQLRQLNQRITARFHLTPFTLRETGDYIRHRMTVAGVDRPLFTARAIRQIHQYSGGIPRLINILCDRALLGTCVTRGSQVTPAIVARAAREVQGEASVAAHTPVARPAFWAAGAFVLALSAGWWGGAWRHGQPFEAFSAFFWQAADAPPAILALSGDSGANAGATLPASAKPTPEPNLIEPVARPVEAEPEPPPLLAPANFEGSALQATLDRLTLSEADALRVLLKRWRLAGSGNGPPESCEYLVSIGLGCEPETGTLANLRYFNLPALLRIARPDDTKRFVALIALGDTDATLALATGSERISTATLERLWTGDYLLVWRLPPGGAIRLAAGSEGEDVRWLRQQLAQVPGLPLALGESPRFDAVLDVALRTFQLSRGLQPDGIAGPRTLIQLHHAVATPGIPRLGATVALAQPAAEAP